MIDLVCSLGLFSVVVLAAVGYGFVVIARGAQRFARVERDGGSALLGKGVMTAGYWAYRPVGEALARVGATPDSITLASLALGFVAAAAIATGHFGVAAVFATAAAVGDGLDGLVARATGRISEGGEVLDAVADRYQEFAFLSGVALAFRTSLTGLSLTLAALCGAMMTSYVSARAASLRVEVSRGAMRRPERAVYLIAGLALTPIFEAVAARYHGSHAWANAPMLLALAVVGGVANVSAVRRLIELRRALAERAPSTAQRGADRSQASKREAPLSSLAGTLARHQTGAVLATLVDFATMTAMVEMLGASPVSGTALGATLGAVTNFTLSRRWVFRARGERAEAQALRYALVSLTSLGLNTFGEYVLASRLGFEYLSARVVVSLAVSLLWNFPMHRQFVFRQTTEAAT